MSNPSLAIRINCETLRTLAFGAISGTYAAVGARLVNPARILYILNTTDGNLTFTWDTSRDMFVVAAGGFLLLDITSNHTGQSGVFNLAQGNTIYVKGTVTSGSVYISSFYGDGTL